MLSLEAEELRLAPTTPAVEDSWPGTAWYAGAEGSKSGMTTLILDTVAIYLGHRLNELRVTRGAPLHFKEHVMPFFISRSTSALSTSSTCINPVLEKRKN